ncbi:hypothetical protein [Flexithrix dorotheae]|uniref:hypothetical protein n=1 Tax=Flexithrix dorotheae TaxID=70993 RepID=UPI000373E42D|nr:hypothetical protein [Flexithrix dorotheae]
MLKSNHTLMYTKTALIILVISVFLGSCSEDEEPTVNPLVGTYTVSSATFINETTIIIDGNETTFPAGSDAVAFFTSLLYIGSPCQDPTKSAITLKESNELFLSCIGEDTEEKSGTWVDKSSEKELQLIVSITGISFPITITLQDYVITDGKLSGQISNFPMPKDTGKPIDQNNLQFVDINAEFSTVE